MAKHSNQVDKRRSNGEWAKHLRPKLKRAASKSERLLTKKDIKREVADNDKS